MSLDFVEECNKKKSFDFFFFFFIGQFELVNLRWRGNRRNKFNYFSFYPSFQVLLKTIPLLPWLALSVRIH